jgi:hypothetical protein
MHIEPPQGRLQSLKDFLKHYLMIVLSILTALGLEAWIEHVHHKHAAAEATAQIDAEIRTNLAAVHKDLADDAHQLEALGHLSDMVDQDLKSNAPASVIQQHVLAQAHNFNLNLSWPTLSQEAWDAAIADQSSSWIDRKRMYRYSTVYATQRDMMTRLEANLQLIVNGPRMIDTIIDLRSGSVDPREFRHVVGQMELIQYQARNDLERLERQMQDALDVEHSAKS